MSDLNTDIAEKRIRQLVEDLLSRDEEPDDRIRLVSRTFDIDEIVEAMKCLLSTNLTMGKCVSLFEGMWNEYMGQRSDETIRSLMVNSGSSANLLALSFLMDPSIPGHMRSGDEVIVPAVTWSTSIAPILQLGLRPVLIDIDIRSLTMDVTRIRELLSGKTKAIMPVHLLGNPCDMGSIMSIAHENGLFVIEDCCEAHGALYNDKVVGTFGDISTFSFFFSHHITTIEGGMVSTKHGDWLDLLRSYRAHGWIRERDDRREITEAYGDLDPRWLFVSKGFNFRPTEINGAFGIHQMDKLEGFIQSRIRNHVRYLEILDPYEPFLHLPRIREGSRHSAFSFGIVVKENEFFTRNDLQGYLEENGIETRPIAGSNLVRHPAFKDLDLRGSNDLPESDIVHMNGFWIGNHPRITDQQLSYFENLIQQFFSRHLR